MAFDDAVSDMLAKIKEYFGIEITYAAAPVVALDITYGGSVGTVHADTAEIEVDVADVPSPAYRDLVMIGSDTWRVHRDDARGLVIKGDGVSWKIPIIKDERAQR